MKNFISIKENVESEITVKKSKFICNLIKVESQIEAENKIKEIKKKYHDARHNCIAYRVIENEQIIEKSSDDGEPGGTAGLPILNVLENVELTNILAIVVRYFGGIKLGTGGLIRAYGGTTNEAIKSTKIYDFINYQKYQLILDYSLSNKIDYFISSNTIILSKEYQEEVRYIFLCNDNNILDKINEYTKGNKLIHQGEEYIEVMI